MEREVAVRILGSGFASHLDGRGRHFRRESSELLWLVDLELIPRTDRVGVLVAVCPEVLAPTGWPTRANNCPIIFYPEGDGETFGIDRARTWNAFDVSSDLSDEDRATELVQIAASISGLIGRIESLADLRAMYARGHIGGFVHKDARALLTSEAR